MQNDAGDMVDLCARQPPPAPALARAPAGGGTGWWKPRRINQGFMWAVCVCQ